MIKVINIKLNLSKILSLSYNSATLVYGDIKKNLKIILFMKDFYLKYAWNLEDLTTNVPEWLVFYVM